MSSNQALANELDAFDPENKAYRVNVTDASINVEANITNTAIEVSNDAGNPVPVSGTVTASQATASNLNAQVVGNSAASAVDSGNPVKIGAVFNTATPVYTSTHRGDLQMGTRGALHVNLMSVGGTAGAIVQSDADAINGTQSSLAVLAKGAVYNGSTWDRARGDTTNGLDVDVTRLPKSGTATVTSVNDSASSVQLLAANTSRVGATFFNDSTSALYIKFGTTASATDFTVKVAAAGYYEIPGPAIYTGRIDGIWSADSTGAVRITELT